MGENGQPPILDLREATLLDDVEVALCELGGDRAGEQLVAIKLMGRINKSQASTQILYLAGEDAAAALVTEVIALASRVSPDFFASFNKRIEELAASGALGTSWAGGG